MLEIKNLSKYYSLNNRKVTGVKDINLKITRGEFIVIEGASGSGKSTLLHIIAGFLKPTSGKILFENKDIFALNENELSDYQYAKIGFIFQNFYLENHLTVQENIALPLYLKQYFWDEEKTMKIMKELGIEKIADHLPTEISGGQAQRTAIGRVLIKNPQIILADEPTQELDMDNAQKIADLLLKLNKKGLTIIVSTHDPLFKKHASRVIKINNGSLLNA